MDKGDKSGLVRFAKEYRKREAGLKGEDDSPESIRQRNIQAGIKDFRTFCNLRNSEFFKPERVYQEEICHILQAAYEKRLLSKTGQVADIVIISEPPGFGKSYTASTFITWCMGKNPKTQVIAVSYNQTLSLTFSKSVREAILDREIEGDNDYYAVSSFFPKLKIKYGDGAIERWSVEGSYMSYLATSFDGSITGMRGNIGIIDDPLKNAKGAVDDNKKDEIWNFYKNTFQSRMLDGALIIVIQTRWASDDLAGRLLAAFPERCYELKLQALDTEGRSICEDLYSTKDLQMKRATLDEDIWLANYMQEPVDKKGSLYGPFKTYDVLDLDKAERMIAYVDTADTGADYLCMIAAAVIDRYAYVLDIYYTDAPMEITEPETARRLSLAGARDCLIESNNGGRGFARNVIRHLHALRAFKCFVTWFSQSKNKKTRILSNATNVMEQVIMPEEWEKRFPEFARAVKKYQRKGKNEHDDAEDTLTGLVEMVNGEVKGKKRARVGSKARFGI